MVFSAGPSVFSAGVVNASAVTSRMTQVQRMIRKKRSIAVNDESAGGVPGTIRIATEIQMPNGGSGREEARAGQKAISVPGTRIKGRSSGMVGMCDVCRRDLARTGIVRHGRAACRAGGTAIGLSATGAYGQRPQPVIIVNEPGSPWFKTNFGQSSI